MVEVGVVVRSLEEQDGVVDERLLGIVPEVAEEGVTLRLDLQPFRRQGLHGGM
jgi:hypothetical protein